MKRTYFKIALLLVLIQGRIFSQNLTQYVNPFIGTAKTGHTFPGATTPFGFIQLSPETNNIGWDYCSGYHYEDSTLIGFAHTHLSGTGWMDLGDVLMLPYSGTKIRSEYRTSMDKRTEIAHPGYYSVLLPDEGVKVELTATQRTGIQRYTFSNRGSSYVFIDLQSGLVGGKDKLKTHVIQSKVKIENNTRVSGYVETQQWVKQQLYFVIEFNKPFTKSEFLDGDLQRKICIEFANDKVVEVRVAVSSVDEEGAKLNLNEATTKTFEQVRTEADKLWNKVFSKIRIEGSDNQKINFYTSMYHLYIQPNNMADADGRYRGADNKVATSTSKAYYSTFSIWDTYRAAHPLYSILSPKADGDMAMSMLQHFDAAGFLPIWTVWGQENLCMIGNHAVPVVVDAYLKGLIPKNEGERVYNAVKQSLTVKSWYKYDWQLYDKYGYFPADINSWESVSRTLEATTDDWCAARLAKVLGKTADVKFFEKRAGYYKNLYDTSTNFLRGRNSDGSWLSPFNPIEVTPDGSGFKGVYTEANAWQYFWHVQHDIPGLIAISGGKKRFEDKLDSLFTMSSNFVTVAKAHDISGMIGQYVHGNEPSHHVAYLYNYTGAPWKTQAIIPQILKSQYQNRPEGLCGNDDCGQMSAWYVFSILGFYPVNPASGEYNIAAPQVRKAIIKFDNGKNFKVISSNYSITNIYIQSVKLNGKLLKTPFIKHKDLINGGKLEFKMGASPNKLYWK